MHHRYSASIASKYFDLAKFMDLLCKKLKATNPVIRQMLISWIYVLDTIPNINMLIYLPSFLDDLFILLDDTIK